MKLFIFFIPLFCGIRSHSSPAPPHFINSIPKHPKNDVTPEQFFEIIHPLSTDDITPACSVSVLNHSFGNTYGSPPVTVQYTPPPVKCKWTVAVLEFRAECKGEQYDRIAGIWIDGIELLRTSTAQPDGKGIFWYIRKDVSRYSSVIKQSNVTVTVMLENLINDEFTGVYHVNISFRFYSVNSVRFPLSMVKSEGYNLNRKLISVKNNEIENKPADLIIPISAKNGVNDGFWFRIQNEFDIETKNVLISRKTYRAVLELYVSFHGDDEFWYMNPSDSYVETNHLNTGRAHGAYREVLVTIDKKLVGAVVPFPVIFTGGINPLFWEPVVSIGAFDLPSYDIDFTPFLGLLLDDKKHSIGIQVADGISFWLVDANLHLWLDHSDVKAEMLNSKFPSMEIERKSEFVLLDGKFEIKGERETQVTSWMNSSMGNLKTTFSEKFKFKNRLKFKDEGTRKEVDQDYEKKTRVKISNEFGQSVGSLEVKINYPLTISVETKPGFEKGTSVMTTNLEQHRSERYYGDKESRVLSHKQNCTGLMVVQGNNVLSGSADNHQMYNYSDESGCFSRNVDVVNGIIVADESFSVCER